MFEQTLLTHPASARKTGALAASFVAQSSVIGVLLVGPLLYTQVMPRIHIEGPLWLPPERPVPPPPVAEVAVASSAASGARGLARPMVVPTSVPHGPIRTVVVDSISELAGVSVLVEPPGIPTAGTVAVLPTAPEAGAVVAKSAPVPEVAKPIAISGGVLAAKLVKRVLPAYPALARQSRVQGTVHLLGTVAKDGRIENLRVLDGPPMLRQAALEAVRQWVYSPTILNGVPVEVEAPIDVNFTLN